MKLFIMAVVCFSVSGCLGSGDVTYKTTPATVSPSPNDYHIKYSPYSPPVVVQKQVCYMNTVAEYGYRQVITYPSGQRVIVGAAIGAGLGHKLAGKNSGVGAVAGAVIGGAIANQTRVSTERVVIGSTQERVCNKN
jgi:uncharacterized protein YcfJ